MAIVRDVVKRLISGGAHHDSWEHCPNWPPDVFAVAATLVSLSGCYNRVRLGEDDRAKYLRHVRKLRKRWQGRLSVPAGLRKDWRSLTTTVADTSDCATERCGTCTAWCHAALRLLAASDAVSVGFGFPAKTVPENNLAWVADSLLTGIQLGSPRTKKGKRLQQISSQLLPHFPKSWCQRVHPGQACVQPKSRTPQVGSTVRALTHHLALLPPGGDVGVDWTFSPAARGTLGMTQHFEVLVIPFPFEVPGRAFGGSDGRGRSGTYFAVDPGAWAPPRPRDMAAFILKLTRTAKRDGANVAAVVLPELALEFSFAEAVAAQLADAGIEIFITGALERQRSRTRNCAYCAMGAQRWTQSKQHRWSLERTQIERYALAHVLDASRTWWEDIELGDRTATFAVFRPGATLTVLICEDLARVDPAQALLRAVGPNLVVALLLDGPQRGDRWPARYATVLADDPGSSVLTLSSIGMMSRGPLAHVDRPMPIALWKELGADSRELTLPVTDHALLLSFTFPLQEQFTLDGRSDDRATVGVSLGQVRSLRHPKPPKWLADARRPP